MKIKELLKEPSAWTKGAYARDAGKMVVDTHNENACCFCLEGAVFRCYPEFNQRTKVILKLMEAIRNRTGSGSGNGLVVFNDMETTTHKDIRAVVELADV